MPARDPLSREMDAMLVAVLAPTITFRATKSGVVVERETRLLDPLAPRPAARERAE